MAYDQGGLKTLRPKPCGGRKRENMTIAQEKALLARFAKAAHRPGSLRHRCACRRGHRRTGDQFTREPRALAPTRFKDFWRHEKTT
jgi:hypothetical protein